MHGKVTLKSLDEVDANYKLLAMCPEAWKKDTAFLQYALMKNISGAKKSATQTEKG